MVEIKTYLHMRFVLCTYTEMLSIQKKEDMKTLQVNKHIFYFELSSKPNVYILGITVSMQEKHDFETIFTSNDVMKIQDAIGMGLWV